MNYLRNMMSKSLPLREFSSVILTHQMREHGVTGSLAATQVTFVVWLHLRVTHCQVLLYILQTNDRLFGFFDSLLKSDGNLDLD